MSRRSLPTIKHRKVGCEAVMSLVESGRHDELLRKGGRYSAFYRLQIKEEPEQAAPIAIASA